MSTPTQQSGSLRFSQQSTIGFNTQIAECTGFCRRNDSVSLFIKQFLVARGIGAGHFLSDNPP